MSDVTTTAPARTFPPRPKLTPENRISGLWLNEVRQYPGQVSMGFTDPRTRARFTLEASKPAKPGDTPTQWVVRQGRAGETSRGGVITEVEAMPIATKHPQATKDGVFFAFVDDTCRRRYVVFENTLPPRAGVTNPPQFSVYLDTSFDPQPYVRPAGVQAAQAGDADEDPDAAPDAAPEQSPEMEDLPF